MSGSKKFHKLISRAISMFDNDTYKSETQIYLDI